MQRICVSPCRHQAEAAARSRLSSLDNNMEREGPRARLTQPNCFAPHPQRCFPQSGDKNPRHVHLYASRVQLWALQDELEEAL